MTTILSNRLQTAIPVSIKDIASKAAYILDPDSGGALTYTEAYTIEIDGETYYRDDLPVWTIDPGVYPELDVLGMTSYADILRSRNPDIWFAI